MADVEFTDNSVKVKAALNDAIRAYLYEAGGALKSQAQKNTRSFEGAKKGETDVKSSWKYHVDESKQEVTVGSPLEASYWEEFGTGEHADTSLNGGREGRKGWWVYVVGNSQKGKNDKIYTKEQAIAVAASMRKKGLNAHATNGITPNRPLFTAFTMKKTSIIKRFQTIMRDKFNE